MAFTVTQRTNQNTNQTSVGSLQTPSFTPSPNSRLFVFGAAERDNHTQARSWSISDSIGSSWTKLDESTLSPWETLEQYVLNVVCWYTDVGASPPARTITVDASALNEYYAIIAFDVTGYDTGTPFAQNSVDNGASVNPASNTASGTLTLVGAPTSGNLVVAMFGAGADGGGGFATPTGYTALVSQNTSWTQAAVFYNVTTTTAAVTSSDLGQSVGNWGGIVFEMKLAGGGTAHTRSAAGGLSPAGTSVKRSAKSPVGVVLPLGAVLKRINKVLAGVVLPLGAVLKRINKVLAGTLVPSGNSIKQSAKTLISILVPSGSLSTIRQSLLFVGGVIAPSGVVLKKLSKGITGVVALTGVLVRKTAKSFVGAISPAGALTSVKTALLSIGGSITPAATLVRQSAKKMEGVLVSSGRVVLRTAKSFVGVISPVGALTAVRATLVTLVTISGTISSYGVLSRQSKKLITGVVAQVGVLSRQSKKLITGVVALTGVLVRKTAKSFVGAISLSGILSIGSIVITGLVNLIAPARSFGLETYTRSFNLISKVRKFILTTKDR